MSHQNKSTYGALSMARKGNIPPVPANVTGSGRTLWTAVLDKYELEDHEQAILREACRTATAIDKLQAAVDRDGVLNESSQGVRAHPALVELRQQRLCFARLVAQLGIPADDRKVLGIRGAV